MPQARPSDLLLLVIFLTSTFASAPLHAQSNAEALQSALARVSPRDRVVQPVEDDQRVWLEGNPLPAALSAYETGAVDGSKRLDRMVLVLKPDPTQQAALDALTTATIADGGFNSALTLAVSGLHTGVTAALSPAKISAPGSGSSTLTLTASRTATLGSARIQVAVTGTGFSGSAVIPVTLVPTTLNTRVRAF